MSSVPIKNTNWLRQLLIVLALCIPITGCRSDPKVQSYIEMLNAERRTLEDQLYELEYDYERKVRELEEAKEQLRSGGNSETPSSRRSEPPLQIEIPESVDEDSLLSPPIVSPGEPEAAPSELPAPTTSIRSNRGSNMTQPVRLGPTALEPDDPRITHIHIDPLHTGGSEFDQQPGDDGLLVVIEPRNRNDAFVPLAGPLSVVVLDYAKREAGDEARIGRWELTARQVDRSLHNNSSQRGIYLRLPWSDVRPENSKLMVAVRYTTADGRKLEATRDVFVTLPGQFSQRWTPRSSHDSGDDQSQSGINVARQPSGTDGASVTPSVLRHESIARAVAPVSGETPARPTLSASQAPTWSPNR